MVLKVVHPDFSPKTWWISPFFHGFSMVFPWVSAFAPSFPVNFRAPSDPRHGGVGSYSLVHFVPNELGVG